MRKLTIVAALTMLSFISFGQKIKEKNVPQAIQHAFHQKYPNVKEVKWDKEENNYEASFEVNNVDNSVLFNPEGKIIETEVEIRINQLPKNALNYINAHFKNKKIKEAAKISTKEGAIIYEAEIQGKDVIFDQNGTHITRDKV